MNLTPTNVCWLAKLSGQVFAAEVRKTFQANASGLMEPQAKVAKF